ncbi:MAG: hypothetical protein ABH827_05660 [bacterium]
MKKLLAYLVLLSALLSPDVFCMKKKNKKNNSQQKIEETDIQKKVLILLEREIASCEDKLKATWFKEAQNEFDTKTLEDHRNSIHELGFGKETKESIVKALIKNMSENKGQINIKSLSDALINDIAPTFIPQVKQKYEIQQYEVYDILTETFQEAIERFYRGLNYIEAKQITPIIIITIEKTIVSCAQAFLDTLLSEEEGEEEEEEDNDDESEEEESNNKKDTYDINTKTRELERKLEQEYKKINYLKQQDREITSEIEKLIKKLKKLSLS